MITIEKTERAVLHYLEGRFELDATLDAVPYLVQEATSTKPLPDDRSIVVVRVASATRVVATLHDVMAELIVLTPTDVAGLDETTHAVVTAAVSHAFDRDLVAGLAEAWDASVEATINGWTGGDFYVEGWQPGQEDTQFAPHLPVKLGVQRVAD